MRIKSLWSVTIRTALDWWGDNCLRLAASLAYYTALSLAPLLLLIVGLTGMVLGRAQVATQLAAQLEGLMGPAGRELVTSILTTTSPKGAPGRPSSASSPWSLARQRSSASSRRR
jgi:membrane protein